MPRKARGSTAPPGSYYDGGDLLDIKTTQKVLYSTHICTVFRETLPVGSEPNQMDAIRVMEKNYKKRQAHATLGVLDDRYTIVKNKQSAKEPFRPWLSYREIVDLQTSAAKPEYFVITVNSELRNKYYYEVYKCKTKEDVRKFQDYVQKAKSNSKCTISGSDPSGKENRETKMRSIADFEFSQESLGEHNPYNSVYQTTSPTPPDLHDPYSPMDGRNTYLNTSYPPSPEIMPAVYQHRAPTPPVVSYSKTMYAQAPARTPSPKRSTLPSGLHDLTYIKYDPHRGAQVANEGPIYMYSSSDRSNPRHNPY